MIIAISNPSSRTPMPAASRIFILAAGLKARERRVENLLNQAACPGPERA
jgi:hypothetical protein